MTRHRRHRPGFSLLELLVVLFIIALLIALSIGAIMRTRMMAQVRTSSMVVEKLQVGLEAQYKAIFEQAKMEIRSQNSQAAANMLTYFSGDADAAQAMLTYCYIRQSFPQTFAEVNTVANGGYIPNGNVLNGVPYFTVNNNLPFPFLVKSQFLPFVGVNPGTNLTASEQSAILLFAALSGTGAGGSTFVSDETLASNQMDWVQAGVPTYRVYIDAWKQPVGFCRFGTNSNPTLSNAMAQTVSSLQDSPFVNQSNRNVSNDPLDPAGKLQGVASSLPAGTIFLQNGDVANATTWNGSNRRPVIYSTGPNGSFLRLEGIDPYESLNMRQAKPGSPADDILGYQLTQLGQQGIR